MANNLKWNRNRATGSYTSVTGRWVISKSKKGWVLEDLKIKESYDGDSLKECQGKAEEIFAQEEAEAIENAKRASTEDLKPVEARVITQDSHVTPSPLEGFIPVQAKILK